MFPPTNDLIALLCIDLVLSAGCLRLLSWRYGMTPWIKWLTVVFFILLWCPVGDANLPLVAYVRGISSDLSISLSVIACISMYQRFSGAHLVSDRERQVMNLGFAAVALLLYPFALGWGDWDSYRLGWGSSGMWVALLVLSLVLWCKDFRLLPVLIAICLLAWTAGALETNNLWDYLIDPWLAVGAIFQWFMIASKQLRARFKASRSGVARPLP